MDMKMLTWGNRPQHFARFFRIHVSASKGEIFMKVKKPKMGKGTRAWVPKIRLSVLKVKYLHSNQFYEVINVFENNICRDERVKQAFPTPRFCPDTQ